MLYKRIFVDEVVKIERRDSEHCWCSRKQVKSDRMVDRGRTRTRLVRVHVKRGGRLPLARNGASEEVERKTLLHVLTDNDRIGACWLAIACGNNDRGTDGWLALW